MFKASERLAGAALALALCSGCAAVDEPPLEHLDLGAYIVSDFKMPLNERGAASYAQRLLGKTVTLGPDRILFPPDFGESDCQHEGYRLTQRPLGFIPAFELGAAGPLSPADAEITDRDLVEVWNGCLHGAYLSVDHEWLYLPGRGALFILRKL
jgi:hypothetical protein